MVVYITLCYLFFLLLVSLFPAPVCRWINKQANLPNPDDVITGVFRVTPISIIILMIFLSVFLHHIGFN